MSNTVKICAAVGMVLLAGILYYVRSGGANDLTTRTDFNTKLQCMACKTEFPAKLDVADVPPFKCPQCGKKDAWFEWKCDKCGTVFLPPLEGNPPRQPMMPKCPKCGSQNVGRL